MNKSRASCGNFNCSLLYTLRARNIKMNTVQPDEVLNTMKNIVTFGK